jgi:hypothetical protein
MAALLELNSMTPTGFEPVIFWLRRMARRPNYQNKTETIPLCIRFTTLFQALQEFH